MKNTIEAPRLARTGSLGPLSESIIPAEPGRFYAYSPVFTDGRPLYALLDCKANKGRPLAQASELGHEVHVHFAFDSATRARASAIKMALAAGLLGRVKADFDDVWVADAKMAIEDFYALCAQRDSSKLADICKAACWEHETSLDVAPETIVAVMTSGGKYGLFLVKELAPASAHVDACHVWLP